jgi:Ca-activated chloride channel homolog
MPNRIFKAHLLFVYGLLPLCLLLTACDKGHQLPSKASPAAAENQAPHGLIELILTYDNKKQPWLKEVTAQFNRTHYKINTGQIIQVKAIAMRSTQIIDEVLSEKRKVHLISPVSSAVIKLGNAQSEKKTGQNLVGHTKNLVLSPIVIALQKSMAEKLGWDKQRMGWADLAALAKNPPHDQLGQFKFGHPHPEYSHSGLLSLLAQIYAGADKLSHLTVTDIKSPQISTYLHNIQQTIAYYGDSSHFFQTELKNKGADRLTAAVLYEHQVIRSYQDSNRSVPLVAMYPKEGTFWSEHPIGIVKRNWVTAKHYEAAQMYIDYLLDKPQQEKALQYGFRPANISVPLSSPLDAAHGINPLAPFATLEMPNVRVIQASLKLWHQNKKQSSIVIVLDKSGGMRGDKIHHARQTILQLLEGLKQSDELSVLSFNHRLHWVIKKTPIGQQRHQRQRQIKYQFAGGGTALYEAIEHAYRFLQHDTSLDKMPILIILSDGKDRHSPLNLKTLLDNISSPNEKRPIRLFSIGYGSEKENKPLREIAKAAGGQFYIGHTLDTDKLFKQISTFF